MLGLRLLKPGTELGFEHSEQIGLLDSSCPQPYGEPELLPLDQRSRHSSLYSLQHAFGVRQHWSRVDVDGAHISSPYFPLGLEFLHPTLMSPKCSLHLSLVQVLQLPLKTSQPVLQVFPAYFLLNPPLFSLARQMTSSTLQGMLLQPPLSSRHSTNCRRNTWILDTRTSSF